jgi:serine/threonine protein kinase
VEELAEKFQSRYHNGERPPLSEYAGGRSDLADRIRQVFPTLVLIESLGPPPEAARPRQAGRVPLCPGGQPRRDGVMYEAVQGSLGRRVTLQVFPADRGRGPFLERFWGEARSAARLHHTNIVPLFGVGRVGDTHFSVMQYINGRGLDCLLEDVRSRPLATQLPRPESATLRASVGSTEASTSLPACVGVVGPKRASVDSTVPNPQHIRASVSEPSVSGYVSCRVRAR